MVKRLLMWVDNFMRNWEWTDDLADFLWSGRCYQAIVLVSSDIEDMDPYLEFAQVLRAEGEGRWTVSVQRSDDLEPDRFCLVQFRGSALFWWGDKVRNDWFFLESSTLA